MCKCAGERAAQWRIEVERCQDRRLDWRKGRHGEDRCQGIGNAHRQCPIVSARAFVLSQRMIKAGGVCTVLCSGVTLTHQAPVAELLSKLVRVAQTQIKALASDGVKCLSGIPDPDLRLIRIRIE